jgi:hypothetical protein
LTETTPDKDIEPQAPTRESLRAQRAQERLEETTKTPDTLSADKSPYRNKPFDSSYQSMLFGSAGTLAKPAWSDTTRGRIGIRMFTRGILGAAMFTIGGRISRQQLANYHPDSFEWANAGEKPLQALAKSFDVVFGKPIAKMARWRVNTAGMSEAEAVIAKANAEWDAVNFRSTTYYNKVAGHLNRGKPTNGRSLGAEMVSVSFDFAMMSVGDALGRNFIQMIDPNIRKTWIVNDEGKKAKEGEKSHFSPTKFLKSQGWAAWRILSKNQGEDWAAALPYVYQMRAQRRLLSHAFSDDATGVKLVLDNAWNGGAYKVNSAGKITGDHQLAGAIDLHTRFVGYNVYTLMFREGYDALGQKLKKWKNDGFPMDVEMPKDLNPFHAVKDATRYVAKSFIKANLYMNPGVVPFWLMRVPQSKWKSALINSEAGVGSNAIASLFSQDEHIANAWRDSGSHLSKKAFEDAMIFKTKGQDTVFNFNTARQRVMPGAAKQEPYMYMGNQKVANPLYGMNGPHDWRIYDGYEKGFATNFSKALNPFGAFSHWLGGKVAKLADALPDGAVKHFIGLNESELAAGRKVSDALSRETFMRNMTDASLAYTPYFIAKSEFGLRVDDTPSTGGRGPMDKAIYKLIDNVCALNPSQTGASIKEIWHLSTTRERALIMREGNENHPDVPALAAIPHTKVHAEGRTKHTTLAPVTPTIAAPELDKSTTDTNPDKRWAETVTNKNLEAHFQANASHTRH